ncbi:MAG: EF-hand domain-containing protein [Blastocatellia bacterium]
MKRFSIIAACLFAFVLSTSVLAQNPNEARRGGRQRGGGKLKQMDANQDGTITRDEWKGKPRGFERMDRNGDGNISREEATTAGRGKRQLKQMDTNNDQRISRDEWKGDPEAFGKLDANNDGILTTEELKARRRRKS